MANAAFNPPSNLAISSAVNPLAARVVALMYGEPSKLPEPTAYFSMLLISSCV